MICFELLTGKVPFEDSHLQGDKMSRNIRAGERPLFPFHSPKYVASLTKKCWHSDPNQRPSFSSICRILRYIKRFLIMNPEHSQPNPPMPPVDFSDIEAGIIRSFPYMGKSNLLPISQIPFQMFAYRVTEKEKPNTNQRDTSDSGSDGASACGDDNVIADEPLPSPTVNKCISSPNITPNMTNKKLSLSKKSLSVKANKLPGTLKGRSVRPPQITPRGRTMRMNSESQLMVTSPKPWRTSGHVSDSELS
ncbi:Protein kinase superfamily protein [Forsythia ovata]|uniref:Protein kinase superfamily protein n=1 Tax=Forsythia ovata TaxID=205694 RepID=A0ABD1QR70_9LAMI